MDSRSVVDVDMINSILYRLFEFDFFVEDSYFQRLNDLLNRHINVCSELGKSYDHFGSYMERLEERKAERECPMSSCEPATSCRSLQCQTERLS